MKGMYVCIYVCIYVYVWPCKPTLDSQTRNTYFPTHATVTGTYSSTSAESLSKASSGIGDWMTLSWSNLQRLKQSKWYAVDNFLLQPCCILLSRARVWRPDICHLWWHIVYTECVIKIILSVLWCDYNKRDITFSPVSQVIWDGTNCSACSK